MLTDDALELASARRTWFTAEFSTWARAWVAWVEGDLDKTCDQLGTVVGRFEGKEAVPYLARASLDLAEACGLLGRSEAAATAAARAVAVAASVDNGHYRGIAALADSYATLAAGRHDDAAARAREATAGFSGSGYVMLEGRALEALGRASSISDRTAAVDALERAHIAFHRCGAEPRARGVLRQLRDLGKPGRRAVAAVEGPDSLTKREREIAALAIQGLTARQIAGRMHISGRTVETHLANIYAKVGVASKVELARRAAELGLG